MLPDVISGVTNTSKGYLSAEGTSTSWLDPDVLRFNKPAFPSRADAGTVFVKLLPIMWYSGKSVSSPIWLL